MLVLMSLLSDSSPSSSSSHVHTGDPPVLDDPYRTCVGSRCSPRTGTVDPLLVSHYWQWYDCDDIYMISNDRMHVNGSCCCSLISKSRPLLSLFCHIDRIRDDG